ncbi:Chitinase 1 [Fusarium oxysporum f. sp. cubense]|uniref:chitinase n=1 Tax=Fusarium oxysporum f. sp. cubense TaxID=61366 RepID=A0A559LIM2_FUSOC|nr:Chitinase 1 [Fusarium oxysporum f. sp. cubense]
MWTMPVVWLNFLLLSVFQQFLTAHGEPLMVTRSAEANGYVNTVYFTNWGVSGRNYEPKDLPVSSITHLLYAFVGARADGTVYSIDPEADIQKNLGGDPGTMPNSNAYGCVKEIFHLKKQNPHFKVLLSIGGWTLSSTFPAVASTSVTRKKFASSAVELMKDWGFDGIDVDWEYPAGEDEASNFLLLLQAVREELDFYASKYARNHHFELSIAAPAGPDHYRILRLSDIGNVVDHINLMAYDYAGSFSATTGHTANLYTNDAVPGSTPFSSDTAIKAYLAAGVPPRKLVLGIPLYGRSFENTDGLGQKFTTSEEGSWEKGTWGYKELPRSPSAKMFCDQKAEGCYSYDPKTNELISFDIPAIVEKKVAYIKELGLAGSMFWEASGDRSGSCSLIGTSHRALGSLDSTKNWLDYPVSRYDNIRESRLG